MDQIETVNLVPKFLEFYQKADREAVDAEERWALWQEYYGFAAVPPGDEGQQMARQLLDDNWEHYQENIEAIRNWTPNHEQIEQHLSDIKQLLGYEQPIHLVVIYFVGGFEGNPFVAPYDEERHALCLPIETELSSITLYHELTHIVHSKTANFSLTWERPIASTIMQEGLATRVSQYMVPGLLDEDYIEIEDGWLKTCESKRADILEGIYPYLDDASSEVLMKFLFGKGTTNTEREAYYAGWEIVNTLLAQGKTFKDIASVQESDLSRYIRDVYPALKQ
ncbi:hypothetical protein [Alkalibacillus almallahensis]|uniref:hypothetical protein n=1 Tax=Alkalibacillus almallahensis TaxID=1379154 RepID=UPI001423AF82|nr:hypothetical protein [Alkalibacillus almallahensis]NIK12588.1 hypothetical protein [Alkalibacillus almallahensis]